VVPHKLVPFQNFCKRWRHDGTSILAFGGSVRRPETTVCRYRRVLRRIANAYLPRAPYSRSCAGRARDPGGPHDRQVSNGRTKQILGGALLAIGTGVLLVRTSFLALQACNLLRASAPDTAESLAEVGLAVLHGVQIVAFNRTILFSLLSNILVLFSALAVIAAGVTLLRRPFAKTLAQHRSSESPTGDQ
jgi:hypothetical protein